MVYVNGWHRLNFSDFLTREAVTLALSAQRCVYQPDASMRDLVGNSERFSGPSGMERKGREGFEEGKERERSGKGMPLTYF